MWTSGLEKRPSGATFGCLAALALAGLPVAGCGSSRAATGNTAVGQQGGTGDSGAVAEAGNGGATQDAAGSPASDGAVAPPPPNYLWYVLDETAGSTAHDSSPNHFDITNLTGVTWNQGANFDGVSGGGSTTLTSAFREPPITISVWLTPNLRADSPNGYALRPYPPNALSDDIPGVGGYAIGLNVWTTGSALSVEAVDTCYGPGALCVAGSTQNAQDADGGPSCLSAATCNQGFVAGVTHLIVVAIAAGGGSESAASVYVDGVLFDQTTAVALSSSTTVPFYLGRTNLDTGYGTSGTYDGRIQDVRAYLRTLAVDEVVQLYASGPTAHAPPSVEDAGASD
jgi:hypothetical protein